ncbi:MAG: porin family protein [Chitinophagaceae bacterium]
MRKIIILLFMAVPVFGFAQLGINIAVKAGVNFANISNASEIKAESRTGYMIGGYIAPKPKKFFGFRSEIILSRQGYDFKTNTDTGNVTLDYLLLPQLITLNFTKRIQLHAGAQAAFLLNTGVDTTGNGSSGSLFNYLNRFDYGLVAGGEVSPIGGFFIGARINVSLNNVSKGESSPNFIPGVNAKSNVVQVYAGWRF